MKLHHHMGTLRRRVLGVTALSTAALLATASAAPAAVPTVESTTDRVLQSVSVSMGPDGTTTGVGSSVVRTAGSVEDAETDDTTYAPDEVVGDLPVRVLTSWRTAEGAGTDLSDLQGYDGRVAIDVTVQNLTVKPQMLNYDTAGVARQQAALVGSPLSVTASIGLGDLKPERIVTDDRGSGANVTNGVIGRDADGTTVQWGALLAPPILASATEFSLVVDAKDFDVPAIDLSVQPGLVTDPSIGALVDAAFNPAKSDELELQQRTIELIGQVNLVLAKASKTISDVRSSLTTTAETLGTQTVTDLQASTQSVTSNMNALDSALQSLEGDLSSTLESTGSSAVAELEQAVTAVDQLLGDTSAPVPTPRVDENGCRTTVASPEDAQNVYGNLVQVAGQLEGYASATDLCRAQLRDAIVASIGPDQPTAQGCAGQGSVTCSLLRAKTTFVGITDELRDLAATTVDLLDPDAFLTAVTAAGEVKRVIGTVQTLTDDLDSGRLFVAKTLRSTEQALQLDDPATPQDETGALPEALAEARAGLDAINDQAVALRDALALDDMQAQAEEAVAQLCEVDTLTEPLLPGQQERLNEALALLTDKACKGGPLPASQEFPTRLVERLDPDDYPQLDAIIAASDTATGGAGAAEALSDLAELRQTMLKDVRDALSYSRGNPPKTLEEYSKALDEAFQELNVTYLPAFTAAVNSLKAKADAIPDIEGDIDALVTSAEDSLTQQIDADTEQVAGARQFAEDELASMFDRSVRGMRDAADTVVRDGRQSIDEQKSGFFAAQKQASDRVADSVTDGLAQVDTGVSSSTRDMEAATTLLVADLRKVLLDLGQREVGGGGLLGAMATNAVAARSADYQLGLAGNRATSFANVRARDIEGLQLRQAQTGAAMQTLLNLPAFQLDLPTGSQHRTVYTFTIEDE